MDVNNNNCEISDNINIVLSSFVSIFKLSYVKWGILFLFILVIISICLFIICSYFFIKVLAIGVDDNNILFYKYNSLSEKTLKKYGDYDIKKLYLIRQPLSKLTNTILNIITLNNYNQLITETQQSFPHHIKLIFEIKLRNNDRKLILLEKNNSISIYDTFHINNLQEIKTIKLNKNHKQTINSILQTTQHRLGSEKFFNWHIYKNNCKEFTKQILITMNNYKKEHKDFIFEDIAVDKLMKIVTPTEFSTHIVNSIVNINNIIEKYVLDSGMFD